jgi:hypothetical protein
VGVRLGVRSSGIVEVMTTPYARAFLLRELTRAVVMVLDKFHPRSNWNLLTPSADHPSSPRGTAGGAAMRGDAAAAAALFVLLVSGCMGPASPTPSPTATEPSPTSAAPSPTSDRDRAEAGARTAVDTYYTVLDDVASDPALPLDRLDDALAGDYLTAWRTELEKNRGNGWTQTGTTRIVEVTTQGVDVPSDGTTATVVFDTCYDVSEVDVVDSSGASVVNKDRPDRGWSRLTLTNAAFADNPNAGWRVTTGETLEKEPCAGP